MFKLLCSILLISLTYAEDVDYHDTLDDHFDFEAISIEELTDIMKCLIDQGPCTDVAASWKQHYPQVVIEACGRCNVHQKRILVVLLQRLKKELPVYYDAWRKFNDPEGKYFDKFEANAYGN